MAEKSPKELINTFKFDDSIGSEVNSFSLRKNLFDFGIESDLSLNENKAIPRLRKQFHQNVSGLNRDLRKGMGWAIRENKVFVKTQTKMQKWYHFLRCLQKYDTIAEEEPTFVSKSDTINHLFGGIREDKKFFALKFRGVIYFGDDNHFKAEEQIKEPAKWVLPAKYAFLRFLYFITTRDEREFNGFERNVSVDKIVLKDKKLIIRSNINAIDRDGYPLYLKCRRLPKLELVWTYCAIIGAKTFVHGIKIEKKHPYSSKIKSCTLTEVDVIDVPINPQEWGETSAEKYFSYLDQSLDFIKSCVDSELVLFEFFYKNQDKSIDCFRHESTDNLDHFLPEFYTQS